MISQLLLATLAALNMTEERHDATFTAALSRQLEHVKAQTYDKKYPQYKARKFIPLATDVDNAAETVTYRSWDHTGMAKVISNYAEDLPRVEVGVEETTHRVVSIGLSYDFSVQDLRRAGKLGESLPTRKAFASRKGTEARIDQIAATGLDGNKIKGFVNHPNIPILAAAHATDWVSTTPSGRNIVKQLHAGPNKVFKDTKELHRVNTVLLPTDEMGYIRTNPVGTAENQTNILQAFLADWDTPIEVDSWHKLENADASGTGPRMIAYEKSPENLELVIPQEYEAFPEQAVNLAFVVPTHARVGGVIVYYPLSAIYVDGI